MVSEGVNDMASINESSDSRAAYALGRKHGLATAALALSLISFVNLIGAEKGLLALVLGIIALSGGQATRSRARIAIGLAVLQLCTILVVILLFRDQIAQLLALLSKLG